MLKRAVKVVVLVGAMLLMTGTPVLAIANPDSGPFILQVDAYQNLDVTGDTLFLVKINIPYASPPSEPSSSAFIGRVLLAGETVAETTPYAYYNSGYGYSTFAIYASSDITWEAAYTIDLTGSPTLSWAGNVPEVATTTINWHASASSALSRNLLATEVLGWASSLSAYWSVALLSITAGGNVLSSYGVAYFTNVIPYLKDLCPSVLPTGQTTISYTGKTFQGTGTAAVVSNWPFDFSGISEWMGLPNENLLHMILVAALIVFMCVMLKLDTKMSMTAAFAILVLLVIPGFLSPIVAAATIFVAVLGMSLVFILGKPIT